MTDTVDPTVLSPFSAADFGRAQMLVQIQNFYTKKAQAKTNAISGQYSAKINSISAERSRLQGVRKDVQDARSVLNGTVGRAKSILAALDTMIRTVNKAGQNTEGYTNPQMYAASFDAHLKTLDGNARRSSAVPNLLGVAKQEVSFPVNVYGSTQTVGSAFLGSDYYIVDSEGKYWSLDRNAKTLKRYDVFPNTPTSTVGNIETGLRLDDLSGDSITFTVAPNTASPQTFTGTLHRKGLALLDSWAYDGLATEEGRAKAVADLKSAMVAIEIEVRRYQLAQTTAGFYESRMTEEISGLGKKVNRLTIEQAAAIQKEQAALTREYETSSNTIVQALALQNRYGKMLTPLISDKFAKSFVDILT